MSLPRNTSLLSALLNFCSCEKCGIMGDKRFFDCGLIATQKINFVVVEKERMED
jgi:hypothetical protein